MPDLFAYLVNAARSGHAAAELLLIIALVAAVAVTVCHFARRGRAGA